MIAAAILACAVTVAAPTMQAVIGVESGGNPLALHVNRLVGPQPHARDANEAAAIARRYIAQGYTVDVGLAQVNSANWGRFGLSADTAFDPCRNVAAGGEILTANYSRAVPRFGEGQQALKVALSEYNTGSDTAGFQNGYVRRYYVDAPLPVMPAPTLAWPVSAPALPSALVYSRPGLGLHIASN